MNVFFDCEFTTIEPNSTPRLISIGCVAHDGSEFYAELNDSYATSDCSEFVIQTVLPLLQGKEYAMSSALAAAKLKSWIEEIGNEVIMRSDAPEFDWPLVASLFDSHNCWPKNLKRNCGSIKWDRYDQAQRYSTALAVYWSIDWKDKTIHRHHALDDARSLYFAWKSAIKRGI